MPCPVRSFDLQERAQALTWLATSAPSGVPHHILPGGVLVIEPDQSLRSGDVDDLAGTVERWHRTKGALRGIVIHAHTLPGWLDAGSMLQHVLFSRDDRLDHVPRVALAADEVAPPDESAVANPLVEGPVRHFGYDQMSEAVRWAAAGRT